jgi:hypothetical protein
MMNASKLMTIAVLGCSLAACGGGGSSTTAGSTSTSSSSFAARGLGYNTYVAKSGVVDTALLADTNHLYFARLLLAATEESNNIGLGYVWRSQNSDAQPTSATPNPSTASAGAIHKEIIALVEKAVAARNTRQAQARATEYLNETLNCENGGTVTVQGDLDNTTLLGNLSLTYNECYIGYVRKQGLATLALNSRDTTTHLFTDYILEYHDLTVEVPWAYFLYTGTQHAIRTLTNGKLTKFVVTSDLKRLDQWTDRHSLDMTENTSTLSGLQVTGQLCDGPYGCVDVSTKQAFNPQGAGEVVLKGINNSSSQVYFSNGVLVSRVDSEGDGTYGQPVKVFP